MRRLTLAATMTGGLLVDSGALSAWARLGRYLGTYWVFDPFNVGTGLLPSSPRGSASKA